MRWSKRKDCATGSEKPASKKRTNFKIEDVSFNNSGHKSHDHVLKAYSPTSLGQQAWSDNMRWDSENCRLLISALF